MWEKEKKKEREKQREGRREIFDISCQMIKQYISEGKYAEELKKYEAISAGFVDGDLKILYQK